MADTAINYCTYRNLINQSVKYFTMEQPDDITQSTTDTAAINFICGFFAVLFFIIIAVTG
jgi:hypothetical protein